MHIRIRLIPLLAITAIWTAHSYANDNSGAFSTLNQYDSSNLHGDLTIQSPDTTGLIDTQFLFRLDTAAINYGMVLSKGSPNVLSQKHLSNDAGRWTWLVDHSFQYPSPTTEDRPVMSLDVTSTNANLAFYAAPPTYPVSGVPYKVGSSLSFEGLKIFRLNGHPGETSPEAELTQDGIKLYKRDNSSTAIIELDPANGLTIRNPNSPSSTPVRLQSTGLDLGGKDLTQVGNITTNGTIQASGSSGNLMVSNKLVVGNGSGLGSFSASIGYYNSGSAMYAAGIGTSNTLNGNGSLAVGTSNTATGSNSAGIGTSNTLNGNGSLAVGNLNTATGSNSIAVGEGNYAESLDKAVFGRYGLYQSTGANPTSWVTTEDLFVVGNGANGSQRANALTIKKGGASAIGGGLGTAADAQPQLVVGRYNDTRTNDNGVDHTAGVFIVGAGTDTNNRANAMRVLANGTVLVKESGDLSMGGFTGGQAP